MAQKSNKQQNATRIKLKRGDQVRVMAGKDKGAEGEIVAVMPEKNRVVVKDVNVATKTQRPTQENPRGGFSEREMPIHASNVRILDPETGEPTRISYKMENGEKVRVSAKSGARLDEQVDV